MKNNATSRFTVVLTNMNTYPAVGQDGVFAQKVDFRVFPLNGGSSFKVDGGVVGGETLSRCKNLRMRGQVVVELADDFSREQPADIGVQIVNAALQKVAVS